MSERDQPIGSPTGQPIQPRQVVPVTASSLQLHHAYGFSSQTWLQIGILTLLSVGVFWHNLVRLWEKTNPVTGEANWGHSFCVPIIGLYYLYLNREELFAAKVEPITIGTYTRRQLLMSGILLFASLAAWGLWQFVQVDSGAFISISAIVRPALLGIAILGGLTLVGGWGLGTLLFGLLTIAYGIYPGRNDFTSDIGGVFTLFGLVLMLCGWKVMRITWFPIAFLICAIPWPGLVYSWVASPLQQLAAQVAVGAMNVLGVDSHRSGTKIFISTGVLGQPDHALNVAEACAGLRSLMTFVAVAASIAFLSVRPMWQRFLIVISAIPIAILCNVMRVTGTGLLYRYRGPDWAEGFTHQFVGLIMLIPAFFMILGVGWVLDRLFVEEAELNAAPTAKVIRRAAPTLAVAETVPSASGATAQSVARPVNGPRRQLRRPNEGGAI